MYVVATGSPFDGMSVYGPFDDLADAVDYLEDLDTDSWIVDLERVSENDDDNA